jgi:protease IV
VQQVARGRVWTGADAKERGLVDELGGFWTAVADAKMLANIAADTRVMFKKYPARQGLFGALSRVLEDSSANRTALQGLNVLLQAEPIRALIAVVQAMPDGKAQLIATGLPPH